MPLNLLIKLIIGTFLISLKSKHLEQLNKMDAHQYVTLNHKRTCVCITTDI